MEHQTTYLGDGFTRHADGVIRFDEAPDHVRKIEREYQPRRRFNRGVVASILAAVGLLATAGIAHANPENSMQPAHVYFGTVQSGQHPNKFVTLHNGTGVAETLKTIAVSGSGGYVFTLPAPPVFSEMTLFRCQEGMTLKPGARCLIDVRVHTTRAGWWRSVLRVVSTTGWFNSSELRAHVVAP